MNKMTERSVAPAELPSGWATVRLGDVCVPVAKVNPKEEPNSEFTYIDIGSIDNTINRIVSPKTYKGSDAPSRARQVVKCGDTLFSTVRTYLRNFALVDAIYDDQIASTGFCVVRPVLGVLPKYLYYLVGADSFLSPLHELQRGSSYPAVRDDDVFSQSIPICPTAEQHRIVSKIEELFTKLDRGGEELRKAKTKLAGYRHALLKCAFQGRLTADWREKRRHSIESATALLQKITRNRNLDSKSWAAARSSKECELPDLPENWLWTSLGTLFDVFVGATPSRKKPEYWNGDIAWVSSGEVAFCDISKTRETITQLGLANTSTEVHPPGTVLLGMIGEGKTRGQAAILQVPAAHNQNSAAIRVSEAGLPPEFVFYYLLSEYERTRTIGSGNNQPALNKSRVKDLRLPLAPMDEQVLIVDLLKEQFSIIEKVERELDFQLSKSERLRQSILKMAFSGKLVPQNPCEEPAEKLLERIRQCATKSDQSRRRRKSSGDTPNGK